MFPNRLRALRKGEQLSLKQLAQQLNQHFSDPSHFNTPSQISNWERGVRVPSYLEVKKLALFFNVSMDYLVGRGAMQHGNLSTILMNDGDLVFDDQPLDSTDRWEIHQLISGYLYGKYQQAHARDTSDAYQEHLNLNIDDYKM